MRGVRVLVTGPTGFVGRHLVHLLGSHGARLVGMGLGRPDELLAAGELEQWISCDVADAAAVAATVDETRPEIVVHLAGQASAATSFQDPIGTFRTNALGTMHLLEAVRLHAERARVLVVGTSESYGPQPQGTRVSEDAPFYPLSPYGLSKAAADTVADFYARVHGLHVIRTRSFHHIGPGQDSRFAIPGFARQIAAIERERAEPVLRVGNLNVVRDVTDVRDVAEAYRQLIDRGRPGTAYNVCRGSGVDLSEIVRALCGRARVPVRVEVDPARMRPADVPYLVGDPSRIAEETGWHAVRSVEASLGEVLDEWRRASPTPAAG
jgi:GDP-4-dehydro-6-deoxy-D-mannose reductase